MNLRQTVAVIGLALPAVAGAQKPSSPVILSLPGGTRALALGNTGVAGRDDEVIFYNPAMLVSATGFSASGEYFSSTSGTGALSAVTRFNGGGLGIGMQFASYDFANAGMPASQASVIEPGTGPAASFMAVVGYGQTVKGFRVGVAGKFAEETDGTVRFARPMADVGVSRDFFRTTFALAVQNIGDLQMDLPQRPSPSVGTPIPLGPTYLPLKTTLGAAKSGQLGEFDYAVTGAVSLLRDEFVQPSGGVELNYSWLNGYNIALRAGVRRSTIGEQPLTAGAGFTADRVTFDYALETLSNQRVGHRFGIRVR
jgi:hypothetical protein